MPQKTKVTQAIYNDIEVIRMHGGCNMLDWDRVTRTSNMMSMHNLTSWLLDNKKRYWKGILHGFVVVEGPDGTVRGRALGDDAGDILRSDVHEAD
jgi:hypothetical protein